MSRETAADQQHMKGTRDACGMVAARQKKGRGASKRVGTHRRGPWPMREVVAGAGAQEGCVGCVWDGGNTLRGGWACQRGRGASRGWGTSWVVMGRLIACCRLWGGSPGCGGSKEDAWLGSGRVCISMGAMDGATSWLLRSRARMRMSAVTARQRWAGRQFFWRSVAHTRPPSHPKSGPKKKRKPE